ncbi:MAG: hypothetical protein HC767_10850 [Akkermansiaceae bacterium]|nr:hypothetical protein [Akkermansiaceae bacterium]
MPEGFGLQGRVDEGRYERLTTLNPSREQTGYAAANLAVPPSNGIPINLKKSI